MYSLIIHQDFFERLHQIETESPQLARKIHSKLVELQLYGWCNHKCTKHQKIAWKRAIINKSKYYLLWKDETKNDFNRENEKNIIVRMIANHDDTSTYDSLYPLGTINDYDTHYKASFMLNDEQMQVNDAQGNAQLIFSSPGTGKTISLLKNIEFSNKKFLFLSESKKLIKKASKYLENTPNKNIILTTEQFYKELLSIAHDKKELSFLECKENFIRDIAKAKITESPEEAADIFNHLYAFAMGSTIPYAVKKLFFDGVDNPINKRLIFDSIAKENIKTTYQNKNKLGKKVTKAIDFIFNSKYSRAEQYFPRQTSCYKIIRDHLIEYNPQLDDCSVKKNGRRIDTATKINDHAVLKTPEKFADIDGIIVDEAQDLSPIEISTILIFAHAVSEASGKQDTFTLYFAGDRGQSIFPTGFDINLLKSSIINLFSKQDITEHRLETNLRNTAQITAAIDNINNFYNFLSKDQRKDIKTLRTKAASEEIDLQTEKTSLIYTKFKSLTEYTQFYNWLNDSRNELNYFNCHIINYQSDSIHKELLENVESDIIEDTYTFKGLDTDIAIVPNPISLVNVINDFSKRSVMDEIDDFRIKYAINNFKVAISRATETVVFAQIENVSDDQYQIFLKQIIPAEIDLTVATPDQLQSIILEKFEDIDFETGVMRYLADINERTEQEEYHSAIQIAQLLLNKIFDHLTQDPAIITGNIKNEIAAIITKLLIEITFSGNMEHRQEVINCWSSLQLIIPILNESDYSSLYFKEYIPGDIEKILTISTETPKSFIDHQIKKQLKDKYIHKDYLKNKSNQLLSERSTLETYIRLALQLAESAERENLTDMVFKTIVESTLPPGNQEFKITKQKTIELINIFTEHHKTAYLMNFKAELCQQMITRTLERYHLAVTNEEMTSYISFLKEHNSKWSLTKDQCKILSLLSSHNAPVIQFNRFLMQNDSNNQPILESIATNPLVEILYKLIISDDNISEVA